MQTLASIAHLPPIIYHILEGKKKQLNCISVTGFWAFEIELLKFHVFQWPFPWNFQTIVLGNWWKLSWFRIRFYPFHDPDLKMPRISWFFINCMNPVLLSVSWKEKKKIHTKSRECNKIRYLWPYSPQCNLVADESNYSWPVNGQYAP